MLSFASSKPKRCVARRGSLCRSHHALPAAGRIRVPVGVRSQPGPRAQRHAGRADRQRLELCRNSARSEHDCARGGRTAGPERDSTRDAVRFGHGGRFTGLARGQQSDGVIRLVPAAQLGVGGQVVYVVPKRRTIFRSRASRGRIHRAGRRAVDARSRSQRLPAMEVLTRRGAGRVPGEAAAVA